MHTPLLFVPMLRQISSRVMMNASQQAMLCSLYTVVERIEAVRLSGRRRLCVCLAYTSRSSAEHDQGHHYGGAFRLECSGEQALELCEAGRPDCQRRNGRQDSGRGRRCAEKHRRVRGGFGSSGVVARVVIAKVHWKVVAKP